MIVMLLKIKMMTSIKDDEEEQYNDDGGICVIGCVEHMID